MDFPLDGQIKSGKIEIREIDGLTIENKAEHNKPIPDDVLSKEGDKSLRVIQNHISQGCHRNPGLIWS
jgi:hypothetical protein